MEPVHLGFIGALLGAIVGASASIITTLITGWNSRKLTQDADSLERKERSREFQRNNLLELQDVLLDGMRLTGRAHIEAIKSFKGGAIEGRMPPISEELDQKLLESSRRLAMLTERIADDSLRESINILRGNMVDVQVATTEAESDTTLQDAISMFENTMKQLGVILRESY